jgi:hypothetical protein
MVAKAKGKAKTRIVAVSDRKTNGRHFDPTKIIFGHMEKEIA